MTESPPVALCVGGAREVFGEVISAKNMLRFTGSPYHTFVCNDMIGRYPDDIDYAVTLHTAKIEMWKHQRKEAGLSPLTNMWAHTAAPGVTDYTIDWGGSSGMHCVKIAREQGFAKIILCGIPMTVKGGHFLRDKDWTAVKFFQHAWVQQWVNIKDIVRSFSGETMKTFGRPTPRWLLTPPPSFRRI